MAADVVEWLRDADERHVVEATAMLLRVCRRDLAELDASIRQSLARDPREAYAFHADDILAAVLLDPEYLGPQELERAAALLESAIDRGEAPACASALAQAIDRHRGAHFFSMFAGTSRGVCEGDPIPVQPVDVVQEEFGSITGLTSRPDLVSVPSYWGAPLDGTERLRLAPPRASRHKLVLDARHSHHLDTLFSIERTAGPGPDDAWVAVVPSTRPLEDLVWDGNADTGTFTNVRPASERIDAYRARFLAGLSEAAKEEARIVVLPELSVDAELEGRVHDWFVANPGVAITVAGSRHVLDADGQWRNIARVFMRGAGPIAHEKFSYFEFGKPPLREAIATSNTVTIHAGRRWSFAVLICKDFLEEAVRRLLIDARVRAVLVAAMSPKTALFRTAALQVVQDAQSVVFIANAPCDDESFAAMLARPVLDPSPTCPGREGDGVVASFALGNSGYVERILPETSVLAPPAK